MGLCMARVSPIRFCFVFVFQVWWLYLIFVVWSDGFPLFLSSGLMTLPCFCPLGTCCDHSTFFVALWSDGFTLCLCSGLMAFTNSCALVWWLSLIFVLWSSGLMAFPYFVFASSWLHHICCLPPHGFTIFFLCLLMASPYFLFASSWLHHIFLSHLTHPCCDVKVWWQAVPLRRTSATSPWDSGGRLPKNDLYHQATFKEIGIVRVLSFVVGRLGQLNNDMRIITWLYSSWNETAYGQ